jgi:c-di-GMP-binding flagellar brake protein YcgR
MSFVQREHYRVPINVPVTIELGNDAVLKATCHDISMGGMGLSLAKEIEPQSCGMVRMHYEQKNRKILFAWAQREDPDPSRRRAGIQFVDVDESNKNNLANILFRRLQELEGTTTDNT